MNCEQIRTIDTDQSCAIYDFSRTPFRDEKSTIYLVPFRATDEQSERRAAWETDVDVARFNRQLPMYYEKLLWQMRESADNPYTAGFEVIAGGKPVGYTSLYSIDIVSRCADVSIMIGEKGVWRSGIGSRAVSLLFARARQIGLRHVYATIHEDNEGSIRLFKRFPCVTRRMNDSGLPRLISFDVHFSNWNPSDTVQLVVEELPKN
jgi:RimJ/RimL family protein N-acetyltransferase